MKFTPFQLLGSVLLIALGTASTQTKQLPLKPAQAKVIIENAYKDIKSWISQEESSDISKQGGSATYGEILPESLQHILDDIKLTKNDVFYDLGSGLGKVCIQTAIVTNAQVFGVELSATRYKLALQALGEIDQKCNLQLKDKCKFSLGNILDADLSFVTVVYMCSTCYPEKLMLDIANKLSHNKQPLRVLTLKQFPPHPSFKLVKTYTEKMTWSSGSSVYSYELILPNK